VFGGGSGRSNLAAVGLINEQQQPGGLCCPAGAFRSTDVRACVCVCAYVCLCVWVHVCEHRPAAHLRCGERVKSVLCALVRR